MKQSIYEPTKKVPTANLAVNKSRVKLYNKQGEMPTYYLQKGQEFQIELFNPTTDVVLAKITLNGNPISQGGLVLNPGQRVFLERYLDIAKKFLFDTYEVANTKEVQKAIENNGDFKVEFFKERIYNNPFLININNTGGLSTRTIYGGPNEINQGILRGSSAGGYVGQTTTNINNTFTSNSTNSTSTLGLTGMITNTSTLTSGSMPTANAFFNQSASNTGAVTMDSLYADVTYSQRTEPIKLKKSRSTKSLLVETGRVEKGSQSDQKIKTIDKDFEYFSFHTIECKMLPISQKINTAEDINVKVYCTNCGTKLGKGHKFCSTCGTKA
jgi:hypothetical protein